MINKNTVKSIYLKKGPIAAAGHIISYRIKGHMGDIEMFQWIRWLRAYTLRQVHKREV